jgi:methylthioribose-1-phosphate isomerase
MGCLREIPVTLITDGMASFALSRGREGRHHACVRRRDRIAENDTANKIGTMQPRVGVCGLRRALSRRVRRAAPSTTPAPTATPSHPKNAPPAGCARSAAWSPRPSTCRWNPSFDVTPAPDRLGINERGVVAR